MTQKQYQRTKKTSATVRFVCNGDPGIYATGLLAANVSLALLKATRAGSKFPPPYGFNSPAVALRGGNALVEQLKTAGVEIIVTGFNCDKEN